MFSLCAHMKWAHLPVAGGLYDQDPELLRKFELIFQAIDKKDAEDREKQERENQRQRARSSSGSRGGGRRRR